MDSFLDKFWSFFVSLSLTDYYVDDNVFTYVTISSASVSPKNESIDLTRQIVFEKESITFISKEIRNSTTVSKSDLYKENNFSLDTTTTKNIKKTYTLLENKIEIVEKRTTETKEVKKFSDWEKVTTDSIASDGSSLLKFKNVKISKSLDGYTKVQEPLKF